MNGSVSTSIGASYSLGIDGCNYIGRVDFLPKKIDIMADMLSADIWYDLTTKFSSKLGVDNINVESFADYHFTDECKVENYLNNTVQFHCRVWNPFKHKFIGYEPKIEGKGLHFLEDDLYPSLFVSDFKSFTAKLSNGNISLSVVKYRPYFYNTLFKEQSIGFRYGKYKNSNTKITDWEEVAAGNVVGNADDPLWYVYGQIPLGNLEKGCTYFVCPFSYVLAPSGTYTYLHRKGLFLRVNDDGTLSYNEMPNIPGMDL